MVSSSLLDRLKKVLPKDDVPYRLLNAQTVPRECKPLVYGPGKGHTAKVVHLQTLFTGSKPILALEVYVYLRVTGDKIERTVYIAKADTSGLSSKRVPYGRVVEVLLEWILTYPISKYVEDLESPVEYDHEKNVTGGHRPFVTEVDRRLHIMAERLRRGDPAYGMPEVIEKKKFLPPGELVSDPTNQETRLVLFTRAESQYLFPNSAHSKNKHVLTDSGLLKWWLKAIERAVPESYTEVGRKTLNILNADQVEVRRYFPSQSQTTGWSVGDIYTTSGNSSTPAVYHIPLFPDDPKGRFLEHLVVENRIKRIQLRRFWTELSVQQEFRMGITVGLIGVSGQAKVNPSVDDDGIVLLKRSAFNKLKELLIGIDYGDPEDYLNVERGLEEREIETTEVWGTAESLAKPALTTTTTTTVNVINTLSVKRRRPASAPTHPAQPAQPAQPAHPTSAEPIQVNNLTNLVKRKKR